MLGKKMQDLMNNQIQAELYSAQLYLAMSVYSETENFKGIARWLKVQYEEETSHGMKFLHHIVERGGEVELKAIEAPPVKYGSMLSLFEAVLAHEKKVTALINNLYEAALKEKDYASQIFLQWFITEQVEEEANASEIVAQLKMIGDKSVGGLFQLDHALGHRGK
ncbi:MAG: ferritin [Negativicutes bacterium]